MLVNTFGNEPNDFDRGMALAAAAGTANQFEEHTVKRTILTIASLALVALLGITMIGRSAVDAQNSATPAAGSTTETSQQTKRDAYLAALAEKLGVTAEDLQTAIDETNQELGTGGMMNDRGGSHRGGREHGRGSGMPGGNGHGGVMLRGVERAEAAAFLGISEDDLTTEMKSGKTFLQIASEHGKTTDDVRAFLIQQATAAIDAFLQDAETGPATVPAATPTATA